MDFTRERKMGFKKLIYFMLSMVKESSQNALERYFGKTGEGIYMSQQAFSLARQKVKWEAFRELFDATVNNHYMLYEQEIERWHGFRIHAVDASVQTLPNDPPLRDFFGTCGLGNTSPTGRGSLLYDILNDVVVDARIEPMATDERTIAFMHIDQLAGLDSFEEWKELVLFDRGYPSFELIKAVLERKIHFLMRVRKKFSLTIDELNRGDHTIELERDGQKIPVRVLKFRLDSGEEETLITSLHEKKHGLKTFKRLYFKRWPIETKYDQLKNKLEIENFSGRLVDNIRQDFFSAMVITNLASDMVYEAQVEVETEQKGKNNKYCYKINVNHAIGVLKDYLILTLCEEDDAKRSAMFDEIIEMLKRRVIPIRPNRSLPRGIPRKAKFHHNHKSNC